MYLLNRLHRRLIRSIIVIEICEEYAVEYDIEFNGQKSQFITFMGRDCHKATGNVTICGDVIQATDEIIILFRRKTKQEG